MNYNIKLLIFRDFTKNYIYINSMFFNENEIKNNVQDFFGNLFFSAFIKSYSFISSFIKNKIFNLVVHYKLNKINNMIL